MTKSRNNQPVLLWGSIASGKSGVLGALYDMGFAPSERQRDNVGRFHFDYVVVVAEGTKRYGAKIGCRRGLHHASSEPPIANGFLASGKIIQLRLDADLVTLSVCDT